MKMISTGLFILAVGLPAWGAPRTPADDAQVIERLRVGPQDSMVAEARRLRGRLQREPLNLPLALQVARVYLTLGRDTGDPRYAGRAESALAPWWDLAEPPEEVLVMRAILRQNVHDFDSALVDLAKALQKAPTDAQAWLMQASVQQVRGDLAAARKSCQKTLQLAPRLAAVTCLAGASSLGGALNASRTLLESSLANDGGDASIVLWARTTLAEMAVRGGDAAQAERHYRACLQLAPADPYLLTSYSDFLLDHGGERAVMALLREKTRADNLLLRLAIAEQRLGTPEAAAHVQALRDRFAASHLRGEVVHRREESRFALVLLRDPKAALELALANFKVQREPADARVLLEAAVAANDPTAAAPAIDWLRANQTEDAVLAPLLARLDRGARR